MFVDFIFQENLCFVLFCMFCLLIHRQHVYINSLAYLSCFSGEVFGVGGAESELWPAAAAPHGQTGHCSTHPCLRGHCFQELRQEELACGETHDILFDFA